MLLMILSLLDIFAGLLILFRVEGLVFLIGITVLLKGLSTVAGSFMSKHFLEWMGYIDLITGVILIFNLGLGWFWVLPLLKGIYTLVLSFGR